MEKSSIVSMLLQLTIIENLLCTTIDCQKEWKVRKKKNVFFLNSFLSRKVQLTFHSPNMESKYHHGLVGIIVDGTIFHFH
jgi:hypothetical protein